MTFEAVVFFGGVRRAGVLLRDVLQSSVVPVAVLLLRAAERLALLLRRQVRHLARMSPTQGIQVLTLCYEDVQLNSDRRVEKGLLSCCRGSCGPRKLSFHHIVDGAPTWPVWSPLERRKPGSQGHYVQ